MEDHEDDKPKADEKEFEGDIEDLKNEKIEERKQEILDEIQGVTYDGS
jgi:hypothetical protein